MKQNKCNYCCKLKSNGWICKECKQEIKEKEDKLVKHFYNHKDKTMTRQEMVIDIQRQQHLSWVPRSTILAIEERSDEDIQVLRTYLCKKKEYPSNIKTGYKDLPKHPKHK